MQLLFHAFPQIHTTHFFRRFKSCLSLWNEDLTMDIKLKIENHWAQKVQRNDSNNENELSYYILPMFPYPSGNLHMGHVRVYSISDTIARFHKMDGKYVIHPIGWDAFGLPAENAAFEHKIPPQQWTNDNISTMKKQLISLGFNFNWDKEISTCDPCYYKWTQYIFLKLLENDMAYQHKAKVNWDPVDKTVLADEQVDDNGCSWRSGAKVEKKVLKQWFIRTTRYAQKLYNGLDSKNLENWKDIINLQKHWIGDPNGVVVTFQIKLGDKVRSIDVWTAEPYRFIHGQYLTISKSNIIVEELTDKNTNLKCVNPITNTEMMVYITDDVTYPEGRDVYIACPTINVQDKELSKSLGITYDHIVDINIHNENKKAIDRAQRKQVGGYHVSSKLKDWLISRQRYWGTPIPIIHCTNCGAVPVPYEELPVKLPEKNFVDSGHTLESESDWIRCKCPKCFANARRETDTMDTFVDSSWYFYRFLDSKNKKLPFSHDKLLNKTPVHCYIGGKEHAVLHLYYARFMSYFLHSLGWTPSEEPFKKLLVQGMIMGQSYKVKSSGKYIPVENVEKLGSEYREKITKEPVIVQWEKMSKSKYNGENPQKLLNTHGRDTTRLLMLADVPPPTSRRWSDSTLPGVMNWQHRLWITIREFLHHRNNGNNTKSLCHEELEQYELKLWDSRNYFTATTTYHFKYTHKLSVGISRLQSLTNVLRNKIPSEIIANSKEFELGLASLIIMLTPVTPHFCAELWAGFLSAPKRVCESSNLIDWNKDVLEQQWPKVDDHYGLSFLCKVDGVDRCELKIKASELPHLNEDKALQMMLQEDSVSKRSTRGILRTKYELFPDCRAILHIHTNKKVKKQKLEENI